MGRIHSVAEMHFTLKSPQRNFEVLIIPGRSEVNYTCLLSDICSVSNLKGHSQLLMNNINIELR